MIAARVLALLAVASSALVALDGCDESQVRHESDWSLDRMQEQPRIDPFDPAMSSPPPHTVARGVNANRPAPLVTRDVVERGRAHFDVICAACHGVRGDGDSVVATKMIQRPPPSLLEPQIRALSDAELAEIIGRGYGLMPSYANDLPFEERWATVAYVRGLQIAGGVDVALLPATVRSDLSREAP